MLKYKIDVLQALKNKGYNTTRIRRENLVNEKALTSIRRGDMVGHIVLDKLCGLLELQPGDIIEYVPDENHAEVTSL